MKIQAPDGNPLEGTHVVHQHRLNAVLQRHSARVASPACAPQLQHDDSVFKAPQLDITTVLLNRGTDPGLQQFLDHADNFVVLLIIGQRVAHSTFLGALRAIGLHSRHDRLAGRHGLRDQAENLGLDVCPLRVACLGHGDKVGAVEDRGDALDVEELGCERRRVWWGQRRARREVFQESGREVLGKDAVVRNELQSLNQGKKGTLSVKTHKFGINATWVKSYIGIGCVFSLNEDSPLASRRQAVDPILHHRLLMRSYCWPATSL